MRLFSGSISPNLRYGVMEQRQTSDKVAEHLWICGELKEPVDWFTRLIAWVRILLGVPIWESMSSFI